MGITSSKNAGIPGTVGYEPSASAHLSNYRVLYANQPVSNSASRRSVGNLVSRSNFFGSGGISNASMCNRMEERLKFVARLLNGEKMAVVCRKFGLSRKTGYKTFNRY